MTYIRHVEHAGAIQWVLFNRDGTAIAYARQRADLFHWANRHDIEVVTLH